MGSNPGTVYWMDICSHVFVVNDVCLKRPKINGEEGHGFESRHYILDGHLFTCICCKLCLFERTENKWRRGRGWPILKKL